MVVALKEKTTALLVNRMAELSRLREQGHKIVGYTPGGYMPEELVLACGAVPVPVGLIRGGQHEPVRTAGGFMPRWIDTFCRAQIGYWELKEEALYQMVDLLACPVTDVNNRAIGDSWGFYTDVEVFRFGVPHTKHENGFEYYLSGIKRFREKLEELTGNQITDSSLKEAIDLCNRERQLLTDISLMRKAERPPISGRDFMRLNHASFMADKRAMVGALESLCADLKKTDPPAPRGPRVLLTGSTLAYGDYKIYDLIEDAEAEVVIEEFAEGIRHYWEQVVPEGDLMEALADRYFKRRVPPAWFRPGRERLDFLVKLAKDFKVNGVIWYQLMYRDSYDIESFYFPDILRKETDLSMLKLTSDYDYSEVGPFRTRVEAFVETMR